MSCQLADPSLTALAAHAVADSFVDVVAEQDSSRQRIKSLAETGASLASELAARESGLAEGPEAESELLDLRAKLGLIRSRIENLEIEGANGPRAQVIVRAPTPTEPFRSSRGSLAGLGALIGLALGAGGTAVPSRRVRSRDDGGTR